MCSSSTRNTAAVTKAPDFRFQWVPHWTDFPGTSWFSSSEWKLDDPNSISETWHTHHLHFPSVKSRKEATPGTPASPGPESSRQWTPAEVCLLAQARKPPCTDWYGVKLSKYAHGYLYVCISEKFSLHVAYTALLFSDNVVPEDTPDVGTCGKVRSHLLQQAMWHAVAVPCLTTGSWADNICNAECLLSCQGR